MATTYTSGVGLPMYADNDTVDWATIWALNQGLIEDLVADSTSISTTGGTTALSTTQGATNEARKPIILVSGTLASNATIIVPDVPKLYAVVNATTGNFTLTIKPSGGTGVTVAQSAARLVVADGATHVYGLTASVGTSAEAVTVASLSFATGGTIDADSGTGTCSSNAVTISKMAGVITTESLTTAAGSSQAITLTNTTIASGDMVFVQRAGGTSTTGTLETNAVAGSGSATITLTNRHASAAFNGTFILNFLVVKA